MCLSQQDANLTLAFGRRYGLVGRNGTGKTTLLRAMAQHQIKGIPPQCQILHVEQEVRSGCTGVVSPLSARHASLCVYAAGQHRTQWLL